MRNSGSGPIKPSLTSPTAGNTTHSYYSKTSLLPNYRANIPAALQQLPELLEQATMTAETLNAMQMEPTITPDPVVQPMGPPEIPKMPNEVQEQPDFPVNIAQQDTHELEGKYDCHPALHITKSQT